MLGKDDLENTIKLMTAALERLTPDVLRNE
jgi:hypothetical protein